MGELARRSYGQLGSEARGLRDIGGDLFLFRTVTFVTVVNFVVRTTEIVSRQMFLWHIYHKGDYDVHHFLAHRADRT